MTARKNNIFAERVILRAQKQRKYLLWKKRNCTKANFIESLKNLMDYTNRQIQSLRKSTMRINQTQDMQIKNILEFNEKAAKLFEEVERVFRIIMSIYNDLYYPSKESPLKSYWGHIFSQYRQLGMRHYNDRGQ